MVALARTALRTYEGVMPPSSVSKLKMGKLSARITARWRNRVAALPRTISALVRLLASR